MPSMKAAQASAARSPFVVVEKPMPQPGPRDVRIRVHACGICHSDSYTREGLWPGIKLPRSPGHEIAGTIDALGADVTAWKAGQRIGLGWAGGHCGQCMACRRGDFVNCRNLQVPGIAYDGGYQQFVIAPSDSIVPLPDALSFEEAAPILCAGVTTYNALRNSAARPGDVVAIHGIGGLGHLGVQFANKMGFKTVAISKGKDKEALAMKLGAHIYLNTNDSDAADQLQKLGGARVILATAPSGKAISPLFNGLGHRGELIVVGASTDPITVTALQLIMQARGIRGWASGSPIDSADALAFCALTGIRPMIETFPLDKVNEAYDRMITNQVRFRAVLMHP